MLVHDEDDLRAGLRALSAPPPQPAERVERAVGRARAIRRRRAALATAAVLLPALSAGAMALRPTPPPAVDLTNVATWPERRDAGLTQIERNVVADWQYSHETLPGGHVRWLYSGRVAGTDTVAVAFAVCGPDHCPRVVLVHGDQAQLAEPPEDDSISALSQTVDLDPGQPLGALTAYLRSAADPEEGPSTVLFVLAAPDAERATYVTGRRGGTGSASGSLPPVGDGVFAGDIGYLEDHAVVTVTRRDGSVVHQGPVGGERSVGYARQIAGIDLPPGYDDHTSMSGQLGPYGESFHDAPLDTVKHALFVRCVAAEPLRVTMNGATSTLPCDGRTRRATRLLDPVPMEGGWPGTRPAFEVSLDSGDPYTVFVFALAKRV